MYIRTTNLNPVRTKACSQNLFHRTSSTPTTTCLYGTTSRHVHLHQNRCQDHNNGWYTHRLFPNHETDGPPHRRNHKHVKKGHIQGPRPTYNLNRMDDPSGQYRPDAHKPAITAIKVAPQIGHARLKFQTHPLSKNTKLETIPSCHALLTNQIEIFQSIIGDLRYLEHSTQPNILFATARLARHTDKPTNHHMIHSKHVPRYLKGTIQHGIQYNKCPTAPPTQAYTDADFEECEERKHRPLDLCNYYFDAP